ncbi:MAG: multicopper oxidase family protein [Alphaproteobacteria bacterium]|nr:multicopper oxidase family protein [Alphaproteobacteria bacterium]
MIKNIFLTAVLSIFAMAGFAKEVSYSIDISSVNIKVEGKNLRAYRLNNTSPGPIIKANIGDTVKITFNNKTKNDTSIHWHGLLVPNNMDGVAGVTQSPIKAGGSFTYTIPVKQTGTYWYHAHDLTEAEGVYGGIVLGDAGEDVSKENVLLYGGQLPEEAGNILGRLQEGDMSIMHAAHHGGNANSSNANNMMGNNDSNTCPVDGNSNASCSVGNNMGNMMGNGGGNTSNGRIGHFTDVVYAKHLINGSENPITIKEIKDGKVKLRIVNTYVDGYLNFVYSGGKFNIAASDGLDVKPLAVDHLRVAMGETYDIVLTMPDKTKSYELVAFFLGGSAYSKVLIGSGALVPLKSYNYNDYNIDQVYNELKTITPKFIQFDKFNGVENHNFSLVGNHMRYNWEIQENGVKLNQLDVKVGDKIKVKITNNSSMPHPMHLHGHFFKVISAKNNLIKHTINLDPNDSLEFEFIVDSEGKWSYHCHNLFHMASGMMITLNAVKG